jgi:hypothetical protein
MDLSRIQASFAHCCNNIVIPTDMQNISERLKLLISSHMLVYPHLQVQDASSGSVESIQSDPLLARHESITCQSSGADHLNLPLSESPPNHCHVQNDGDDEDISDEDFWVNFVSSYSYSIFAKLEH